MEDLKFKIWDHFTKCFVNDPSNYIKFSFVNSINNEIVVMPKIKSGVDAELLLCINKQDDLGIDIYDGDILLFYHLHLDTYLSGTVNRRGTLHYWSIDDYLFEEVANIKVIGHKYDDKTTIQNLENLI